MPARRTSPVRGLLAGLLALVAFASSAVAMTAGGSDGGGALPVPSVPVQLAGDGDGAARGLAADDLRFEDDDDGRRFADLRDGDGDDRFGGRDGFDR